MLENKLWKRKCTIKIQGEGNGNNDSEIDVSNLKCVFNIQTDLNNISTCAFEIYNVNSATENFIVKNGYGLIISAGYEDERFGAIFEGTILQAITTIEEENFKISILAMCGDSTMEQNFIKLSCNSVKTRDQLKLMGDNAQKPVDINISSEVKDNELPRGKTYFNTVSKYLKDITRRINNVFYKLVKEQTSNEANSPKAKIEIKGIDENTETIKAVEISPETGLIGVPQVSDEGVVIRTLLDPRFIIDGQVKLKNSLIQRNLIAPNNGSYYQQYANISETGDYRIMFVRHTGDTYGDTWISEIICKGPNSMFVDGRGVIR